MVRGRGIRILGFTVTGVGRNGISVERGGTAFIRNCTIRNIANNGLVVTRNAEATVFDSTIEDASDNGVSVALNSSLVGRNLNITGTPNIGLLVGLNSTCIITNLGISDSIGVGIEVQKGGVCRIAGGSISKKEFGVIARIGGLAELNDFTITESDRAIWAPGGSLVLKQTTIRDNFEGIVVERGKVEISNSSIEENTAVGLLLNFGSSGDVQSSTLVNNGQGPSLSPGFDSSVRL